MAADRVERIIANYEEALSPMPRLALKLSWPPGRVMLKRFLLG